MNNTPLMKAKNKLRMRADDLRASNAMELQAYQDACDKLPLEQDACVRQQAQKLSSKIKGLGEGGALELLAAVAEFVESETCINR